jgi:hypothetical protein
MSHNGVMPYNPDRRFPEIDISELKNKCAQHLMALLLLDALAGICINELTKQVVAVSLSLTTEGSVLYIAANDGAAPEIPFHLSGIFSNYKTSARSLLQSPLQEGNNKTNIP